MVARRTALLRSPAVVTSNSSHKVQNSCCVTAASSSTIKSFGFTSVTLHCGHPSSEAVFRLSKTSNSRHFLQTHSSRFFTWQRACQRAPLRATHVSAGKRRAPPSVAAPCVNKCEHGAGGGCELLWTGGEGRDEGGGMRDEKETLSSPDGFRRPRPSPLPD